jgi:hypothetical protein
MAKTLLDFTPSLGTALNDNQLVYLVDPAKGRAGDIVVTLGVLKAYLGVTTTVVTPPPPPPPGTVATPTFSPAAGTFTVTTPVSLSVATVGATIHYTTDGSTPTSSSPTYTGAISVSVTTTIKAIAVLTGMLDSTVASATYTISSGSGGGTDNYTGFINIYGADRAEFPREYLTSRMPVRTGALITVAAGGDFQAALNTAQPGDWIVLEAGATWTGNYTAPVRSGDTVPGGNNVIVVTSSAFASLPEKVRVLDTTSAAFFANIRTANVANLEALAVAQGSAGWRFVGLDFLPTGAVSDLNRLVSIGSTDPALQSTVAQTPKNVIFDRCRFDGHATINLRRAVNLQGIRCGVINSWFGDNIHHNGQDAQAILVSNTPGPLKIVNNRLQGSTEVVLFGGDTATVGMASDVEVRYNTLSHPYAWRGATSWQVKNIFEIKKARRLLFESNILSNIWASGQAGFAILIKHEPYLDESLGVTEDIILRYNKINNAAAGINIATRGDNNGGSTISNVRRVVDTHNLYYHVSDAANNSTSGYIYSLALNDDCVHAHNTYIGDGTANVAISMELGNRRVIKDCIFGPSTFGVKGDSQGTGTPTLAAYNSSGQFASNIVILGGGAYASDILRPASIAATGFTNTGTDDYSIASSSVYKNQASDGTDHGPNFTVLNAKAALAVSGNTTTVQT